ncbi:MAG: ABC transporter substrate-binding protein [Desertimonas sp.]
MSPRRYVLPLASALALIACGDDGGAAASSPPDDTTAGPADTAGSGEVVAGAAFPDERCVANEAAGTITYLSGFDFAAAASIVDVIVADEAGYYEDLCLDVELQPSFSTQNYPFVASGEAQFGAGGSFSEAVNYATANDAELVAVIIEGRVAIDTLIVKDGEATTLEDLEGTTIGVKGAIPPSVAAMLAGAGLVEGEDYDTVPIDGFDPQVHIGLDGIVGFPGYRSNEPGILERNEIPFTLFDTAAYDVPGSFGVIITSRQFLDEHPTAAEDFIRATMRGLEDALADPEAAAATAMAAVDAGGNPNFLSAEGETYRWTTDSATLTEGLPEGVGVGVPDEELLQAEVEAYAEVGLFGGEVPDIDPFFDAAPIEAVYDDGRVIWPG